MMSLSANLKQKQLLCGFIPSKSFLQVSLCHIVYHYPRALPLLCPPGRGVAIILFTTDLTDETDECPTGKRRDQKVCCFPLGLRPCSPMRMLSHVSELPCLTIHICLVCLAGRQEKPQSKIAALGSTK